MKKIKFDSADMILERLGYNYNPENGVVAEPDTDEETITDLMNELGIETSKETVYKLLLWNDEINSMDIVVVALYEICKLTPEEAVQFMMEAHTKGKAVIKSGSFEEMNAMKAALNKRNIEASVEV